MSRWTLAAVLLISLGVGLRLRRFPAVPVGLQQDEASAAYEAWSLLETGKDRWGNRFPPYFPAWGSGQSVLLSYLAVPFTAALGPSVLAVRLPALLAGLATLGLFFVTVRRIAGRDAALVAAVLLAASPWHVMLSRWALDANLLPFTLLLGVFAFLRGREAGLRAAPLLALLPFALTFYAYGVAVLVTPLLVLLLCVSTRDRLGRRHLLGGFLALALAAPFGLFLLKNHVLGHDLGIEAYLPFDVPLLPAHRLGQGPAPAIPTSVDFLLSGLRDDLIWNNLPDVAPLPAAAVLLGVVGLFLALRERDPFALWLIACVPLLLLVPVNVTRANALYLPLLALAARAIVAIDQGLAGRLQRVVRLVALGALVLEGGHFTHHYLASFPRLGAVAFNRAFDEALASACGALSPGETLYLTESLPLNYVYYSFYAKVPPREFQRDVRYEAVPGVGFEVRSLGPVRFHREAAPGLHLLRASEPPPCAEPEAVHESKWWRVFRCR